jgi:hypothetical protein
VFLERPFGHFHCRQPSNQRPDRAASTLKQLKSINVSKSNLNSFNSTEFLSEMLLICRRVFSCYCLIHRRKINFRVSCVVLLPALCYTAVSFTPSHSRQCRCVYTNMFIIQSHRYVQQSKISNNKRKYLRLKQI